jgi:hypothetical protein
VDYNVSEKVAIYNWKVACNDQETSDTHTLTHRWYVYGVRYWEVQGDVWFCCMRRMCGWQVCRQYGFCPVPRLWCECGFTCWELGVLLRSGVHGTRLLMLRL